MDNINDDLMIFIIDSILERANSLQEESKGKEKTLFEQGLLQGYSEVIDIIRNRLIIDDIEIEKYGLNTIDHNKLFV